eukprot:COSAG01_NODE_61672_length_288_cov_1.074074_1_plen_27_part_01
MDALRTQLQANVQQQVQLMNHIDTTQA